MSTNQQASVLGEVRAYPIRVDRGPDELWQWKLLDDAGTVHGESTDTRDSADNGLYATKWLAALKGRAALARLGGRTGQPVHDDGTPGMQRTHTDRRSGGDRRGSARGGYLG